MILSQRQLEEIAALTTKDFNRFFFGDEADKPDRSALPIYLFFRKKKSIQRRIFQKIFNFASQSNLKYE